LISTTDSGSDSIDLVLYAIQNPNSTTSTCRGTSRRPTTSCARSEDAVNFADLYNTVRVVSVMQTSEGNTNSGGLGTEVPQCGPGAKPRW